MVDWERFETVDAITDAAALRALVREAVGVAQQAMAERNQWQRRYEAMSADIVCIPEVTMEELGRMAAERSPRRP